jgi:putative aldouronate transport system substrate-binding protein
VKAVLKKAMILFLCVIFVVISACSNNTDSGKQETAEPATSDSKTSERAKAGAKDDGDKGEAAPNYDPFGRYDETVEMTVGTCVNPNAVKSLPAGDTPVDNIYTRAIEKDLNIRQKEFWTVACTNLDQKISLSIASNDLPDAMKVNAVQLRQLVESDQIEDMTEAVKYASEFNAGSWESTNGAALKSATFNGKIMAIPGVGSEASGLHNLWIRKDWLDKLKLEVPQTLDELEKVAKAFVEQDPDGNGQADTIGIVGPDNADRLFDSFLKNAEKGYGNIFYAMDAYPGYWVEGSDGKAVYGSILPESKEALAKLRDWYAAGLLDKQMGIRKDADEPIIAGKAGIFFQSIWAGYTPITDAVKNDNNANWQAYALPLDDDGKWNQSASAPSTEYIVVKKGFKHPEAAMKLVNYRIAYGDSFEHDHGLDGGNMPMRMSMDRRSQMGDITVLLERVFHHGESEEILKVDWEPSLYPDDYERFKAVKKEPYDNNDIQHWNLEPWHEWNRIYVRMVGGKPLTATNRNDVYSLTYSQTKSMEGKWANLDKLETETFYKIIMGTAPLDSFDQFVEAWKKQGGDQITAEVEANRQ